MKNFSPRYSRRGPDHLLNELTLVLSGGEKFEFKPLFLVVHSKLRDRNAAHGGEEMLRLRMYEKLQSLVNQGSVQKSGKSYRVTAKGTADFASHAAAEHCRDLLSEVEKTPSVSNCDDSDARVGNAK